ncbi:hypothetical protein M2447_000135 [Ereboglobus sp. PH5-10]|nr:hypothetical protein [Ereboglobus sp. PH5-10]
MRRMKINKTRPVSICLSLNPNIDRELSGIK